MRVLLLAGGAGTRLWPLSSEHRPKQFLPLLSQKSLLAETYERVLPLTDEIFVATTENHADLVLSELKSPPADRVVLEPFRRNSGPALLSAALQFERDGDPVTAAIPSDQTVADAEAFRAAPRRVAGTLMAQVERYRSRLRERDDEGARRAYGEMPSISIDYAVMEKAASIRAVPLRAGWSDVGTWRSVRDIRGPSDDRGNLIVSEAPVLAPGVRDTAIVVSGEGVLVLPFERENELRTAVERLLKREEEDAGRS